MKTSSTSERLKKLMNERQLKQVDILNKCKPFCDKYGVRMGRNDISQYVSGKVIPSQQKLTILALGLNVDEAWLMGYETIKEDEEAELFKRANEYIKNLPTEIYNAYGYELYKFSEVYDHIDTEGKKSLMKYLDFLIWEYNLSSVVFSEEEAKLKLEITPDSLPAEIEETEELKEYWDYLDSLTPIDDNEVTK